MTSYSGYYRPALKSSTDIQLQNAFNDKNWPAVIRLADRRAKSSGDAYFEVGSSLRLPCAGDGLLMGV